MIGAVENHTETSTTIIARERTMRIRAQPFSKPALFDFLSCDIPPARLIRDDQLYQMLERLGVFFRPFVPHLRDGRRKKLPVRRLSYAVYMVRAYTSSFMQCKAENQPQRRPSHQQHLSINCTPHSHDLYREAALTTPRTWKMSREEITLSGRTPSHCNVTTKAQHLRTTHFWTFVASFS